MREWDLKKKVNDMPMIQGARRFSTDPFLDAANQNTAAWQARIRENNLRYGNAGMMALAPNQQYPQAYYGQPLQKRPRMAINHGEFGGGPQMGQGGQMGQMGQAGMAQNNPVMQMLASGQDAMNQANKANMNRFNKIMKGYLKRHDEGMKLADARSGQAYKEMAGNASQQMVNRGMFNSMEAARKQFDSFEKSRQIPLDQFNKTSGDPLLFAERRNDTGPDMGQLLQLAQMAGQSQAGMGPSQSGIAGQSSPMSQGVNVGSYPAALGMMAVQQRQERPKAMGSPIFAGVMNPYAMMAASGLGPGGSPYGLSARQMQNKANRQAAGGYDAWRAQGGQQGQQQPQQAGQFKPRTPSLRRAPADPNQYSQYDLMKDRLSQRGIDTTNMNGSQVKRAYDALPLSNFDSSPNNIAPQQQAPPASNGNPPTPPSVSSSPSPQMNQQVPSWLMNVPANARKGLVEAFLKMQESQKRRNDAAKAKEWWSGAGNSGWNAFLNMRDPGNYSLTPGGDAWRTNTGAYENMARYDQNGNLIPENLEDVPAFLRQNPNRYPQLGWDISKRLMVPITSEASKGKLGSRYGYLGQDFYIDQDLNGN